MLLVHLLLKPSLQDFEHDFSSIWNECNYANVWTFFGIALPWIGKGLMPAHCGSEDCCSQCPWLLSRPLLTYVSTRDSWTFTGKSGSVSCGVTAPFSCALVHTRFCLFPPRICFPVLWNFCNQVPLAFKFPGGSQSLCWIPSLGNLLWALELLQLCKNFFAIIVLQFVGHLFSSSKCRANGNLLQEDLCHTLHLTGLLQPEPLSPRQGTAGPFLHRRQSNTQRQVWLSFLWRSLLPSLGPGVHEVLFVPSEHLWWVWNLILNMLCPCYQLVGLLLCPWMWNIFLSWGPTFCLWLFRS